MSQQQQQQQQATLQQHVGLGILTLLITFICFSNKKTSSKAVFEEVYIFYNVYYEVS